MGLLVLIFQAGLAQETRVVIGAGKGVEFQQVDFKFAKVTQVNSDWGRASVDPTTLVEFSGIKSGFLNVFTQLGWSVVNLPVSIDDGSVPVVTYFSLGLDKPTDIGELPAYVEFRIDPIKFEEGLELAKKLPRVFEFEVGVAIWNAEGFGEPIPRIPRAPRPTDFIKHWELHLPPQRACPLVSYTIWGGLVNIQAARSQCAPMAVANSLQYLEHESGISIPHEHWRGQGCDSTMLVGQLDCHMGRSVTSRCSGGGVNPEHILTGKFSYLDDNGLSGALVHEHQGFSSIPNGDLTRHGITSQDKGARVTLRWICDQIERDRAVFLCYGRDTGGGHCVRVFGCGETECVPWLMYLHDAVQCDDTHGLEQVHVNTYDMDGDGIVNFGSMDREIMLAMSAYPRP